MDNILFLEYPKCSTCQKAKKWLDDHGFEYEDRHIVEQNPTELELAKWITQSGLPMKKFFNTSGLLYKSLNLKEKLPVLSDEEQINLLASNGMLVKRPLLVVGKKIIPGFNEDSWKKVLKP